jgi:hypothetical protein
MPNPSPKYKVSLKLGDLTFTKIAPSIVEALEKMQPTHLSKAKGVLTVSSRGLKTEILMYPLQLKRLFINKTARTMFQKRAIGVMK